MSRPRWELALTIVAGAAADAVLGDPARMWPSAANFLLLRALDGPGLAPRLLRRGIAVRPAGSFPGLTPDHLRVAIRTAADNERLLEALEA